ncbi:MAG: GNAT family N-acetyltransferase [Anaerofustis sp.]
MNGFQPIETDRLILRTLALSDTEPFFSYRSMPEVFRYQSFRPKEQTDAQRFIETTVQTAFDTDDTWFQAAICLKDGRMIGDLGVHFFDDGRQAELGYTLDPYFQGKGYAREAVNAIIDLLFSVYGKHRISASVDPDNQSSVHLLEALGFCKEAHFVQSYWMDGIWCDDCVYAILQKEWV